MRTVHEPQMKFGEVDIATIELDLKSRDDIPPILRGLQHIYTNAALRASVFKVLERGMEEASDRAVGEPTREAR